MSGAAPWNDVPQERGVGWRPVDPSGAAADVLERRRRAAYGLWLDLSQGGRLDLWVHFWDADEARLQRPELVGALSEVGALDALEGLLLEVVRAVPGQPRWHGVVPVPEAVLADAPPSATLRDQVQDCYWHTGVARPDGPQVALALVAYDEARVDEQQGRTPNWEAVAAEMALQLSPVDVDPPLADPD